MTSTVSSQDITQQPRQRGKKRPINILAVVLFGVVTLLSLWMIAPFIWQILTSLKPLAEVDLSIWPRHWTPGNYLQVFREISFGRYYMNSILVAVWVTFLQVITSAFAAYSFSRLHWPGRDKVFLLYLATMMIPGAVLMIPNFWLMLHLHMYNTLSGLIIPSAFSTFGTFLLRQFMMTLPTSLDEAAEIDGASEWQIFLDIILPLARPGLIVLAIFTFMGNYGSFFWPLVLIKDDALRTLPIGMMYFNSSNGTETNLVMAASLMSIIPLIVLFVCLQKYLVKGLQLGAVKG